MDIWQQAIGIWELYQDTDRRLRYCEFKLGNTKAGKHTAITSPALRAEFEAEHEHMAGRKAKLQDDMREWLDTAPSAWPWLSQVKGIGLVYGFFLLATLGDPRRYHNVTAVWTTASLGLPKPGIPVSGLKAGRRRTTGFWPLAQTIRIVTRRLLMTGEGGFYYDFYRFERGRHAANGFPCPKHEEHTADTQCGKLAARAKLAMMRLIVSHVYNAGREAIGLSIMPSYAATQGHTDIPHTDVIAHEREPTLRVS